MKVTRAKSSQTREKGQRRGGKKSKLTHIALACEGCSKAHVKCNGELPCGRCTTRGLHCNYLTRGKYVELFLLFCYFFSFSSYFFSVF
eukprot:TRINITY_DN370_c0_g2_i3.p1 TRINITY_DN370_c0_g2~~TRINITY_DN370_c0_g2_i3.p1  ORF type:complete len:101 (+),score=11.55 TRINITY_DN370_c0_g2_i3:42-305(+)